MRYFIELAYNGTGYSGWQWQENAIVTIQAELQQAMAQLMRQPIKLSGCGRTDAGVHASQYFAHFNFEGPIEDIDHLVFRLNRVVSPSIVVYRIFRVNDRANSRFDAILRTYSYRISKYKDPFFNQVRTEWFYPIRLDVMNEAAAMLPGTHDFGCFCKRQASNKTNICTVSEAHWQEHADHFEFTISANRFLRNMVRAIVGTHLDISRGRMTLEDYRGVLVSGNRSLAGVSAPAQGLFLSAVSYNWDKVLAQPDE